MYPECLQGFSCKVVACARQVVMEVKLVEIRKTMLWLALAAVLLAGFQNRAQAQYKQPVLESPQPLVGVQYDYRWEFYGGLAYSHFNAGPQLVQGANLGGFDFQAARFFRYHWALDANGRGYYGTSGVDPNVYNIRGPAVSQYMFMAGPEYRGPSNEHVSMTFHALFGGAYGIFDTALQAPASIVATTPGCAESSDTINPECIGLFKNQLTWASAIGGSIDLNRSARWAFRISPDATLTHFQSSGGQGGVREQFAISVGVVYRKGMGLKK
jgi:hypothetical protein